MWHKVWSKPIKQIKESLTFPVTLQESTVFIYLSHSKSLTTDYIPANFTDSCLKSTRKSSCVTVRGVLPASYPVHGVFCLGEGGYPYLGTDWGTPSLPILVLAGGILTWLGYPILVLIGYLSQSWERTWDQRLGYPSPSKDLGPEACKEPGTRDWDTSLPSPMERMWDQKLGRDLAPETGVPPPSPQWTDKQSENITFPRTKYANGNYILLKPFVNSMIIRLSNALYNILRDCWPRCWPRY